MLEYDKMMKRFFMFKKKITSYVSKIDEFLQTFDHKHPLSLSQQEEVAKHLRIRQLRDKAGEKKHTKASLL